jgi:hypothetical protein
MISRRNFCIGGAAAVCLSVSRQPVMAATVAEPDAPLFSRARAALDRHGASVIARGKMGIVDFSRPSRDARFHILDLESGARQTIFVAHGKGSDPAHSGWLKRFSNEPGSEASSSGAYLTGATYDGKHGRSRRLKGLDSSNSNAEARALVIHGAWYVSPDMVRTHGMLGRSQGCLAVAERDLDMVLTMLPEGSLIYVDKV